MKTKSYNVYSFAELSPDSKARAISDLRNFIAQEWDGEATIEDAKQAFAYAGFDIERVHYSGFSSQGDGACFTAKWDAADVQPAKMREYAPVDAGLHRIADGMAAFALRFPGSSFSVKQSGHYMHEYCTDFDVSICDSNGNLVEDQDAEKELVELARAAMRWTYRQLELEYTNDMSETAVIELIEGNEYEFTEDGKIA